MNSVTPLLSMIDSGHPENITNSGPTSALKPGGFSADTLFSIHSEKKAVAAAATTIPATSAATVSSMTVPKTEGPKTSSQTEKKSADVPTKTLATPKDQITPVTPAVSMPLLQAAVSSTTTTINKPTVPAATPAPAPVDMRTSYNVHLAALMRQYEIISQGTSRTKPTTSTSDAGPPKSRTSAAPSTSDNGSTSDKAGPAAPTVTAPPPIMKTSVPIQQIFPSPIRNLTGAAPTPGDLAAIPPIFNFGQPFPGFGWPMLPFGNPFAPAFCYPYPPQLSLLQNQFAFQQPSPTPISQQLAASNKKRKASPPTTTKAQTKRAKEIEKDVLQMNLHAMPQLTPVVPVAGTSNQE